MSVIAPGWYTPVVAGREENRVELKPVYGILAERIRKAGGFLFRNFEIGQSFLTGLPPSAGRVCKDVRVNGLPLWIPKGRKKMRDRVKATLVEWALGSRRAEVPEYVLFEGR